MSDEQPVAASRLGRLYTTIYNAVAGVAPNERPWHFQWLSIVDFYPQLRAALAHARGTVLDVGCGDKPYAAWMPAAIHEHVGIDVYPGPAVDFVVAAGERWPLDDQSVDTVLMTEVIEHVANPFLLVDELRRVLRPNGTVIVSAPFLYPVHHPTDDYRRYTETGLASVFSDGFDTLRTTRSGGGFAVLGLNLLLLIETLFNINRVTRMLKGLLLPIWLLVSIAVNAVCYLLDRVFRVTPFFVHVLYIGVRR